MASQTQLKIHGGFVRDNRPHIVFMLRRQGYPARKICSLTCLHLDCGVCIDLQNNIENVLLRDKPFFIYWQTGSCVATVINPSCVCRPALMHARQQLKNIGGLRLVGIVNSPGRYDYLFMRRRSTLLNVIECCYVNKIILIGTFE